MTAQTERPVALVTGAAKRVGRALALDLARQGFAVGVHHNRSSAEAAAVVAEIEASGGRAVALEADLTEPDAVEALVAACVRELGPVTCLVNNASLFLYDDIASLDARVWQQNLAVNLAAPVFLAQAFARQLPPDAKGTIVNLIDQRVWRPVPDFLSYGIAKSGLWSATRMLAQALAPRIRVNAIGPGPALQSIYQTPDDFAKQWTSTPLARGTTPEEIAAALRFILAAPAMTGQMIALDGGQHLDWRHDDVASPETRAASQGASATAPRPRGVDPSQPAEGIRHIFVRELEIDTVIGVLPHEKLSPQRIYVSLDVAAEETGEPGSDRLGDVVDYDAIVATARTLAQAGNVNLLETLAERIAAATLPLDPRILTVRVSIAKPDIYGDARTVGIEIERSARRS
ncbi:MAG: SDR family oxidoreductase [Hyphomicrobiaceae bacterium]|mgnify:CR=1 FL=1